MISHLLVGSADNFNSTWKLLTKLYENKRKIFSEQLNRLIDMPMLNYHSAKNVKVFIDSINESIHLTKAKSLLSEDVDEISAHMIIRKFNRESYESHVKKAKDIKKLSDVIEYLSNMQNSKT